MTWASVGADGVSPTKNGRLKADAVTFQTGRDGQKTPIDVAKRSAGNSFDLRNVSSLIDSFLRFIRAIISSTSTKQAAVAR